MYSFILFSHQHAFIKIANSLSLKNKTTASDLPGCSKCQEKSPQLLIIQIILVPTFCCWRANKSVWQHKVYYFY